MEIFIFSKNIEKMTIFLSLHSNDFFNMFFESTSKTDPILKKWDKNSKNGLTFEPKYLGWLAFHIFSFTVARNIESEVH